MPIKIVSYDSFCTLRVIIGKTRLDLLYVSPYQKNRFEHLLKNPVRNKRYIDWFLTSFEIA